MQADFVISNADIVYTCAGPAPKRGPGQGAAAPISHASVAARAGRIVFAGQTEECRHIVTLARDATIVDARGCTVIPGFVDAHTHLVYAGDRSDELARRLAGASYAEIGAEGGGILKTVVATRRATEEQLVADALPRLATMLACGTTTAEVKSGYGLELQAELRMLRAIRMLCDRQPIELVATFMGAHEIPPEFRKRREDYVRLVIDGMLPAVARDGLADWCDVFCEEGVFTPQESRAILEAARQYGLESRLHANELGPSGGAALAAELGVRSADHLIYVDELQARNLAMSDVIATLLPATAFYLKLQRFAPARMLIDHGVPVALATDLNPGAGLSPAMPFVITLACFGMEMTLEEALVAATINAAASLNRAHLVGSLEPGKQMDAVILGGTLTDAVRVGTPMIRHVVKRGCVVASGRV